MNSVSPRSSLPLSTKTPQISPHVVAHLISVFRPTEIGGGFLGPMISDVRDYYVDNFRFPTL